jgi:hypothetical protein
MGNWDQPTQDHADLIKHSIGFAASHREKTRLATRLLVEKICPYIRRTGRSACATGSFSRLLEGEEPVVGVWGVAGAEGF